MTVFWFLKKVVKKKRKNKKLPSEIAQILRNQKRNYRTRAINSRG